MKHGEEGTHSVCNKHFALLGGKSTCCVCGEKKDCSNTPSPKPCCESCSSSPFFRGKKENIKASCLTCPCHQAKPEVSPEKKEKCEDSQCFDANCSTHGIHPTPPAKEEKECDGKCCDSWGYRDCGHSCHPWNKGRAETTTTPTEQKGEDELESGIERILGKVLMSRAEKDELIKLIDIVFTAKLAQKEQAVKAEIREKVRNLKTTEIRGADEYNNALDEVLDLLSGE